MISIKIQCGCGQKYAFEVEPVGNAMPYSVACPICGVDGTPAANAVIAQTLAAAPAAVAHAPALAALPAMEAVNLRAAPPAAAPLRAAPPAPPAGGNRVLGNTVPRGAATTAKQVDYAQVEAETRARVLWGDAQEDAVKFAMLQGLSAAEAKQMVAPMYAERYATIRKNGIMKIIWGLIMACVPLPGWFFLAPIDFKLFAVTVMVGLWGGYQFLKGIMMVVSPKTEAGDVEDH